MAARDRFTHKLFRCLQHTPDYSAEMERLHELHDKTMSAFRDGPSLPPRDPESPPTVPSYTTAPPPAPSTNRTKRGSAAAVPSKAKRHRVASATLRPTATVPTTTPDVTITYVQQAATSPIYYLDMLLRILHRTHAGYSSTTGDGDCAIHAVLQTMYRCVVHPIFSTAAAARQQAESFVGYFRAKVRDLLVSHADMRNSYLTREECLHILNRDTLEHSLLSSQEEVATLFGLRRKDGGIWFDDVAMRCLAIAIDRDIVVVNVENDMCLTAYPRRHGIYHIPGTSHSFSASVPGIPCTLSNDGGHFIPSFAFKRETLVIVYNNVNHFWCTELATDFTTENDMNAPRVFDLEPM